MARIAGVNIPNHQHIWVGLQGQIKIVLKYAQGKETLNLVELGDMVQAAIDAVQKRGGAKLGDKTLLDALIPAVESIKASGVAGETFAVALPKSAAAAVAGAARVSAVWTMPDAGRCCGADLLRRSWITGGRPPHPARPWNTSP